MCGKININRRAWGKGCHETRIIWSLGKRNQRFISYLKAQFISRFFKCCILIKSKVLAIKQRVISVYNNLFAFYGHVCQFTFQNTKFFSKEIRISEYDSLRNVWETCLFMCGSSLFLIHRKRWVSQWGFPPIHCSCNFYCLWNMSKQAVNT